MKRLSFLTFGDGCAGGNAPGAGGGVNAESSGGARDASGSCTFEPVDFNHIFLCSTASSSSFTG